LLGTNGRLLLRHRQNPTPGRSALKRNLFPGRARARRPSWRNPGRVGMSKDVDVRFWTADPAYANREPADEYPVGQRQISCSFASGLIPKRLCSVWVMLIASPFQ